MASEFTHIFVAGALGKMYADEKPPKRFWLLAALCSVLPDIDIIGYSYGIKYGDVFGWTCTALVAAMLVRVWRRSRRQGSRTGITAICP